MFTGIIEELGTITDLTRRGRSAKATISMKRIFPDLATGDSVAVNGVCLTVTDISRNTFSADISEETVDTTNLQYLKVGERVNLERALSLVQRIGGHLVTGHVDGIVELRSKIAKGEYYELSFAVPHDLRRYIVEKGSVSLDGMSLTVANITRDGFSVMIIPQTIKSSTIGSRQIGDRINLEVDILSKYVEGLLRVEAASPTEKVFLSSGILPIGIIDN